MASIGGVTCTRVSGVGQPMVSEMAEFTIPGIDGIGIHYLGNRGLPRKFSAISFGFSAGLKTWADSLAALVGTTGTIINDQGQTFTNQLIVSVGEAKQTTSVNAGLHDQRWEIEITAKSVA